jgi:hypothetical protein
VQFNTPDGRTYTIRNGCDVSVHISWCETFSAGGCNIDKGFGDDFDAHQTKGPFAAAQSGLTGIQWCAETN